LHADIEWDDQGQPLSKSFGDVYFSKANGLEETRHVFLQHNQLTERWKNLSENNFFVIGETGFGSGLNFLAAWDLWLKTAPASAQLHFVSVEKFPLHKNDLQKALALWPELEFLSAQLIAAYPCFVGKVETKTPSRPPPSQGEEQSPPLETTEGIQEVEQRRERLPRGGLGWGHAFYRLSFMQGRIKLTLIIDDAAEGFTKLLASTHPLFMRAGFKINAWFLDGFAPAKNPQMWSDELFSAIANLSELQTTVATFSAAALVKNGLKNAGFSIEKVAGFGRKREMVKGQFAVEPEIPEAKQFEFKGSFSPYPIPWTISDSQTEYPEKTATIIGGGISGCHTARALAERGWQVTLIERHHDLAQEASGNPQGAVYAKLSMLDEAQAAFNLHALQFALHYYANLWPEIGEQSGLLQLAYDAAETKLHQDLLNRFSLADDLVQFVSAEQASQIAGVELEYGGLYFPKSGWINPKKLCQLLTNHSNINIKYESQAIELNIISDSWEVSTKEGLEIKSNIVVLANSRDAANFEFTNHLPFNSIRGQVTYLPQPENLQLKTVVCTEGYISPAEDGQFCIGATFNLRDSDPSPKTEDHQTNFNNLKQHLPRLADYWRDIEIEKLNGRVAFRASLPDYLPAVGQAPNKEKIQQNFAPLSVNARAGITQPGNYHQGLFVNLAQGSRGLTYTPLCAELLASIINKEPLPTSQQLANALNPARFLIRGIVKRKGNS
jgi:tRNA 5-methylaminomethyl-2-thiouridine biosynthesis bifunctional protein